MHAALFLALLVAPASAQTFAEICAGGTAAIAAGHSAQALAAQALGATLTLEDYETCVCSSEAAAVTPEGLAQVLSATPLGTETIVDLCGTACQPFFEAAYAPTINLLASAQGATGLANDDVTACICSAPETLVGSLFTAAIDPSPLCDALNLYPACGPITSLCDTLGGGDSIGGGGGQDLPDLGGTDDLATDALCASPDFAASMSEIGMDSACVCDEGGISLEDFATLAGSGGGASRLRRHLDEASTSTYNYDAVSSAAITAVYSQMCNFDKCRSFLEHSLQQSIDEDAEGDNSGIPAGVTAAQLTTCACDSIADGNDVSAIESPAVQATVPSCSVLLPATSNVDAVFVVAGEVSDYTDAVKDGIRLKIVAELEDQFGQDCCSSTDGTGTGVEVYVESASVRLTISITNVPEESVAEGQAFLNPLIADPASASTLLSTSSFPVTVTAVESNFEPVSGNGDDDDDETIILIAAVAGGAVVAIVLLIVVLCCCCKKKATPPPTFSNVQGAEMAKNPPA